MGQSSALARFVLGQLFRAGSRPVQRGETLTCTSGRCALSHLFLDVIAKVLAVTAPEAACNADQHASTGRERQDAQRRQPGPAIGFQRGDGQGPPIRQH